MSAEVSPPLSVLYQIDAEDRICHVNETWEDFAQENAGQALICARVLGQSLWDQICDATTRELYRQMVKRAREGHTVRFHYRCDAPDRRRLFRMTITPVGAGVVEFVSQLRREEVRPKVMLLDRLEQNRSEELVRICSWCEKAALPDGRWVPVEEGVEAMKLMQRERLPGLTHGICEHCKVRMLRQIERTVAGRKAV
ncbi:MAG: hypothetical protein KIT44_02305 [Opitutaceae bacterium]|nr:hypothetical protein [Opitutaceae bacterium]